MSETPETPAKLEQTGIQSRETYDYYEPGTAFQREGQWFIVCSCVDETWARDYYLTSFRPATPEEVSEMVARGQGQRDVAAQVEASRKIWDEISENLGGIAGVAWLNAATALEGTTKKFLQLLTPDAFDRSKVSVFASAMIWYGGNIPPGFVWIKREKSAIGKFHKSVDPERLRSLLEGLDEAPAQLVLDVRINEVGSSVPIREIGETQVGQTIILPLVSPVDLATPIPAEINWQARWMVVGVTSHQPTYARLRFINVV